jgi:hypothetical protein
MRRNSTTIDPQSQYSDEPSPGRCDSSTSIARSAREDRVPTGTPARSQRRCAERALRALELQPKQSLENATVGCWDCRVQRVRRPSGMNEPVSAGRVLDPPTSPKRVHFLRVPSAKIVAKSDRVAPGEPTTPANCLETKERGLRRGWDSNSASAFRVCKLQIHNASIAVNAAVAVAPCT